MITVHGHLLNTHLSGNFQNSSTFSDLDKELRDNIAKDLGYRNLQSDISRELSKINIFGTSSELERYIGVKIVDAVWRSETEAIHFEQNGAYGHDYTLEVDIDLSQVIAEKYMGPTH